MFQFTISLGQVIEICMLGGFMWYIGKRAWEHDLMWKDYCGRLGIDGKFNRQKSVGN